MGTKVDIRHYHMFCGLGGGALGFNKGNARIGSVQGNFRCIGGIDVDPAAIRDFEKLSGASGTVLDLFSRDQYIAFHGKEPPLGWKEATIADIHQSAGGERPHIIFLSAPCKGFSGIIQESLSATAKYQALNNLTIRGVWMALEAFKADPVELFIFENVPRIQARGRKLLNQIVALFRSYGYAVAETTHDCGELGGLAQSRRRFLLVARHQSKVPAYLFEPQKRPLRAVGEVLSPLPLPGDITAGPMHIMPSLQWRTWVRLAFVEAGKDWRSLERLGAENQEGMASYLSIPDYRSGFLGVNKWHEPMGTVAGRSTPTNGKFSIADPRYTSKSQYDFKIVPRGLAGAGALLIGDYAVVSTTGKPLPADNDIVNTPILSLDGTVHRPLTRLELAVIQGLHDPEDNVPLVLDGISDGACRERIGNAVPPPAAQAIASMMGETLLLAWTGETFTLSCTPVWVKGLISSGKLKQFTQHVELRQR
jgi:site-specific DNA-cytosine methylase